MGTFQEGNKEIVDIKRFFGALSHTKTHYMYIYTMWHIIDVYIAPRWLAKTTARAKKIWMHNIREKQKATVLSCSLFLAALDRFSAFWFFLPLRSKLGFIQQLRCLSINQISLTNLLPCQFSEVLIENCTAHFPSSRNNQIDAASNQSKQVHKMLVSLSLRTFMWRWSGKWFQIVYNIFIRVRQCFATF